MPLSNHHLNLPILQPLSSNFHIILPESSKLTTMWIKNQCIEISSNSICCSMWSQPLITLNFILVYDKSRVSASAINQLNQFSFLLWKRHKLFREMSNTEISCNMVYKYFRNIPNIHKHTNSWQNLCECIRLYLIWFI